MIVLLSYDNKELHRDRAKYITVRNWSLVEGDTATINKFDYVDFIYSDVNTARTILMLCKRRFARSTTS